MKDDNWQRYIQIGLELSTSVFVFSAIGIFLDKKLNTKPYLTISGIFLGISSVFYLLWKKFFKDNK